MSNILIIWLVWIIGTVMMVIVLSGSFQILLEYLWLHKNAYTIVVKNFLLVIAKRWNGILLLALLCYLLDLNSWVTSTTLVLEVIALLVERKLTYGVMEIPQVIVVRRVGD